jgi:hypothetical protein
MILKAILENKWEEVPAEVTDFIEQKLNCCEKRTYDKSKNKLDKPSSKKFS